MKREQGGETGLASRRGRGRERLGVGASDREEGEGWHGTGPREKEGEQ